MQERNYLLRQNEYHDKVFAKLPIKQKQNIRDFIEEVIDIETEDKHTCNTVMMIWGDTFTCNPVEPEGETIDTRIACFYCNKCEEPLDSSDLIEHVMDHMRGVYANIRTSTN